MSAPGDPVRVPLSVDARYRLPLGSAALPVRSLVLAGCVSPLAYVLLGLRLPGLWSVALAGFVLAVAASLGIPERHGVWVGTDVAYRQAWRVLPSVAGRGGPERARVSRVGGAVRAEARRRPLRGRALPGRLRPLCTVPVASSAGLGILELSGAGHHAVLVLDGPAVSVSSGSYPRWCEAVAGWLEAVDCPAQVLTLGTHHDAARAGAAFDARVRGWPPTPLRAAERDLVASLAAHSLRMQHLVVLSPRSAGGDGVPYRARAWRSPPRGATAAEADSVLQSGVRLAQTFALAVHAADRDDLAALLVETVLGADETLAGTGALRVGDRHHVVLTATRLPAVIDAGCVVDALSRARAVGVASLHIVPVAAAVAQRQLHRRSSMLRHAQRQGADAVEAAVALQDTTSAVAALARRDIVACRVALTVSLGHSTAEGAAAAAERLGASLAAAGFGVTDVAGPGLLPSLAVAPGCPPLLRSLVLTSGAVAARMLPCLGTPFADVSAPLVGTNVLNGSPAHFSIWQQANHNLVVLGSSGAGKSVAAKTLLLRHLMEGASAVVIDPDSEYRATMAAIGGRYLDLGAEAINPLAVTASTPADAAAGLVLPVLSVMAGDDRGMRDGRPIRRLPDEDQGWLHGELADFYDRRRPGSVDLVMHDLVHHLQTVSSARALTERERERCRVITARLQRFTQGRRAEVFDRPSTFTIDDGPVAVGLRSFAMSYGADLTPALAVLLTAILGALGRQRRRLLIVVDEAHRVTSDPDAGEVLGQVVRQARKHGAGVWMLSQRVEDFVRTDLGRTLAATAASKLVLGAEEAVLAEVRDVFRLTDEEAAAICPASPGRGVLLAGPERAVVSVVPGPVILALAATTATASVSAPARAR